MLELNRYPTPKELDEADDHAYGRLSRVVRYHPARFMRAGELAALYAGLKYHHGRVTWFYRRTPARELRELAAQLDLWMKDAHKRLATYAAYATQPLTPTVTQWAAVFGEDAAINYAAQLISAAKHDRTFCKELINDLNRNAKRWTADQVNAVRNMATERNERSEECRLARANKLLARRMPCCWRKQRGVMRFLVTEPGETTVDFRKNRRRAVFAAAGSSPDTNGWDNIVKNWEETPRELWSA